MAKLIGLTGPARGTGLGTAGCGKDTAAAALVKAGWTRDAFADRMRTAILALDPFVPTTSRDGETRLSHLVDYYGWDDAKREFPEVRRLLQKFGTEAGRDIHGVNCWVSLVLDAPSSPWSQSWKTGLVITDCRFENEAEGIRREGGYVVSIVRPGLAELDGGNSAHASESGLPPELIDATIVNDGTVEDLHGTILRIAGIAAGTI